MPPLRFLLDVNAELVRKGLAKIYHTQYRCSRTEEFAAVEKEAREAKRGLWGDANTTTAKDKPCEGRSRRPIRTIAAPRSTSPTRGRRTPLAAVATSRGASSQVSLKEAKKRGYEPCKVCNPPR
jgi:micrococcal nuclease